ncbi:MAG: CHAT domain-containing protein, partial [Bacteroidota bacterium]
MNFAAQAFQLAEKSKSILLFDAIKNSEARFAAGVPDSLLSREQNLRSEIAYYQDQLYQENRKAESSDSLMAQYRKQVFDRTDGLNKLVKQFETAFPSYYNLKYSSDNISLSEVQKKLAGTNSQLVEYFVGESSIFIIAITADEIKLNQVAKDAALDSILAQVLESVHGEQVFEANVFASASFALYEHILAPLIDPSKERLIIIPDGQLGYLPFETLLTASQNAGTPPAYLIQSHALHYAYSAQLLYRAPNPHNQKAPKLNWLGYAPNYQGTEVLPYNQEEVKNIARLFEGEARYGEAASLADFMAIGTNARFLHLSMHGYPNEDNPMYSYLAFAGDSLNRLHAYQIFDLQLNSELVVLSACKTAYGPLAQGEGIMSLSRAFRYAGCPSILTSLWSADGSVAKDLLADFYAGLQDGKAKDLALREAKLNFLQSAPPN